MVAAAGRHPVSDRPPAPPPIFGHCGPASEPDELPFGVAGRSELEAEDGVAVEGFSEPSDCLGAGAVLAAFDPGDRRGSGAHAIGQRLLREFELRPTHDHHPGELLEGSETVVSLAVLHVLEGGVEPYLRLSSRGRSTRC